LQILIQNLNMFDSYNSPL